MVIAHFSFSQACLNPVGSISEVSAMRAAMSLCLEGGQLIHVSRQRAGSSIGGSREDTEDNVVADWFGEVEDATGVGGRCSRIDSTRFGIGWGSGLGIRSWIWASIGPLIGPAKWPGCELFDCKLVTDIVIGPIWILLDRLPVELFKKSYLQQIAHVWIILAFQKSNPNTCRLYGSYHTQWTHNP